MTKLPTKPRILITCPVFPEILDQLSQHFDLQTNQIERTLSESDLIDQIHNKQAVFSSFNSRFTEAVLRQAPELKIISAMTVGYDNINLAVCQALRITVTNAPEVLNQTTADFAWALLLATARRVPEADQWARQGEWKQWHAGFLGADVHGKTLGILGMGRIGQAIARRSMGFDMQVLYHNRTRLDEAQEAYSNNAVLVSKEELLSRADYVILMVPYSTATHHCMGAAEFAQMRSTAILINVARGGVVDDAALITALRNKQIAAAGLDVFENEPHFNSELRSLDNVVMTPHIASASRATRLAMQQCAVNNLISFFQTGRVISPV